MKQAILLGIIQGFTEFLPISSSGHLVLVQTLLKTDLSSTFDIFVHTGTFLATLLYFWPRIKSLTKPYFKNIILASIPAGIIGLTFKTQVLSLFSSLTVASLGFLITTLFLATSKLNGKEKDISLKKAFLIGLAQALAIVPGISRSGSTITTALNLNIDQKKAFTFSFLLSLPSIFGASLLNLLDMDFNPTKLPFYFTGFLTAALSGYLALYLLEKIIQKAQLKKFAYYTLFLAFTSFIFSLR